MVYYITRNIIIDLMNIFKYTIYLSHIYHIINILHFISLNWSNDVILQERNENIFSKKIILCV